MLGYTERAQWRLYSGTSPLQSQVNIHRKHAHCRSIKNQAQGVNTKGSFGGASDRTKLGCKNLARRSRIDSPGILLNLLSSIEIRYLGSIWTRKADSTVSANLRWCGISAMVTNMRLHELTYLRPMHDLCPTENGTNASRFHFGSRKRSGTNASGSSQYLGL